jgi:3-deoxy-D-manno-octulosonic-acid transferase
MGLWYRLSPLAFVGGSLVDKGGQNPLEAARLGCALLFGPYYENNASAVSGLEAAGALECIGDAAALGDALEALLDDPALCAERGAAARRFAEAQDHIVEDVVRALAPVLPPPVS